MNHPVLSSATVSRPVLHSFTQSHSVSGVKQHFSSQLIPQNSFKSAKETSLICWFVLPAARSCGNGWGGPSFPALQFYSKRPFLRNSLQWEVPSVLYNTILHYYTHETLCWNKELQVTFRSFWLFYTKVYPCTNTTVNRMGPTTKSHYWERSSSLTIAFLFINVGSAENICKFCSNLSLTQMYCY